MSGKITANDIRINRITNLGLPRENSLESAVRELIMQGLTEDNIVSYLRSYGRPDPRYNEPKEEPKVPKDEVDKAIEENDIYKKVQQHMLNAQKRQVAYGLQKYPETLNKDSWSVTETLDHIIEETVDKLHYLTMLRIQLGNGSLYADGKPVKFRTPVPEKLDLGLPKNQNLESKNIGVYNGDGNLVTYLKDEVDEYQGYMHLEDTNLSPSELDHFLTRLEGR